MRRNPYKYDGEKKQTRYRIDPLTFQKIVKQYIKRAVLKFVLCTIRFIKLLD